MKTYDVARDGITQSLLGTWLACRQKARWYLQGYSPRTSSLALTYGTIGHAVLEHVYKDLLNKKTRTMPDPEDIRKYIGRVEDIWRKENPRADKKLLEHLEFSLLIAEATLPAYFKYWVKDLKEINWKDLERQFAVPYITADGRKTIIRGKMDGVFNSPKLWLFENKFKSMIEESDLVDTLPFELQIMLYTWALKKLDEQIPQGVLYNIIRRTCLRQKKEETLIQFADRCVEDIKTRPEFYFIRMQISITPKEMVAFEGELEDMVVDFMDWWEGIAGHYKNTGHCIDKYGRCNFLPLCSRKDFQSFDKRDRTFSELEPA